MNHRLIAALTSAIMSMNLLTTMPIQTFALGTESKVYEKDGYTVTYKIGSEWENNRSVEVTLKNTGEESILNWALKYDVGGEVYNLWNSTVYSEDEDGTVIKNNGYNYEIMPGQSANYGYIVTGAETLIPEDIELCSRKIDVKSGYEIDFNVTNDWYTGFQAELTIENTSNEPIEAWTLLFEGNFDIVDVWNAKLLSSENRSYETANQLWTTPIKARESASFGFTANKSATENAAISDCRLTAVVVGESVLEKEPTDPDDPYDDIDYELDTDEDGLPDYKEINFAAKNADGEVMISFVNGVVNLPTYRECTNLKADLAYVAEGLNRFDGELITDRNFYNYIDECGVRVLPIVSDPTSEDGDRDGISDCMDKLPLQCMPNEGLLYQFERRPGLTETGELAEDLTYNDKSIMDLYLMKNKLGDIAKAMTNNKFMLNKSIDDLTFLFTMFSINADSRMKFVIDDMLYHFRYGEGTDYMNSDLSAIVAEHPSSQRYMRKNYVNIINSLIDFNGDLDAVLNSDSLHTSIIDVGKPRFNQAADIFNGLKICIDDTWGHKIEISNYEFDGINFSGTIRYTIYDHFGLDSADVSQDKTTTEFNMGNFFGEVDGFASWICFMVCIATLFPNK